MSKMSEEKSANGKSMLAEEEMPETTTRGSETGEDMPRPDMTIPGTQQIGEMPASEMSEQNATSRKAIPTGE
jgi:hypothetical protein